MRQAHEAEHLQRRLDKQTALRRSLEAHLKGVWRDFTVAARRCEHHAAQAAELAAEKEAVETERDAVAGLLQSARESLDGQEATITALKVCSAMQ